MEIGEFSLINWLLLFAFCFFCGFAAFYLIYGAASMFRGDAGQNDAEAWLLERRTTMIAVFSLASLVVIAIVIYTA